MTRAILLVLDSFGIGAAPDAATFGDAGADTFGHIAAWCAEGNTNDDRSTAGPLTLPNLTKMGLVRAAELVSGQVAAGMSLGDDIIGAYGACAEVSHGKDTPSGHWEMTGLPVTYDWGYFTQSGPAFPENLLNDLIREANIPGILGNKAASGTTILEELGDEHIRTGKPICYTSGDSIFQIAAHEAHFGLEHLYHVCDIARKLVDPYNIGRVVARPFVGENGHFTRTGNRRDLATPPHGDTLLDVLKSTGREVITIGKIADIFAHRGMTKSLKANGLEALVETTLSEMTTAPDGSLIFTNLVNFDQDYGHRRNVGGYAAALEWFDGVLPTILEGLKDNDLLIMTADHGCDPTATGSDHTREHVPFLAYSKASGFQQIDKNLGLRDSFSDIGQTIAQHLGVAALEHGSPAFKLSQAAI